MIRDIVLYPDIRLETLCSPVEEFDTGDLRQLVADLFESMYFHGGVGLAAPQIGTMKQVAVIDRSLNCSISSFRKEEGKIQNGHTYCSQA